MNKEEIIAAIYNYYPKGLMNDEPSRQSQSPEYHNRVRICREAFHGQKFLWDDFKFDLQSFLTRIDANFADYTALGTIPSYFLEIGIDKEPAGFRYQKIFYLVISIITPFWSFRFLDTTFDGNYRYQAQGVGEIAVLKSIQEIILDHFPKYSQLPDELRSVVVPDIDTPHSHGDSVTIFKAIFVDN